MHSGLCRVFCRVPPFFQDPKLSLPSPSSFSRPLSTPRPRRERECPVISSPLSLLLLLHPGYLFSSLLQALPCFSLIEEKEGGRKSPSISKTRRRRGKEMMGAGPPGRRNDKNVDNYTEDRKEIKHLLLKRWKRADADARGLQDIYFCTAERGRKEGRSFGLKGFPFSVGGAIFITRE